MADTGAKYAATVSEGTGGIAWAVLSAAALGTDDTTYATVTASTFDANAISNVANLSNFSMGIPTGATIDGILVEINRATITTGTVHDSVVSLSKSAGTPTGDNKATATSYPTSSAYATASYGGVDDKWGTTWTVAEVNATGFGLVFSMESESANQDAGVDFIRITVYYTPADTTLTVADSGHAHTADAVPTVFYDMDEIQRSAGDELSYATVQHLAAGVDTWDDTGGFTNGVTYYYRGRHWTGSTAGDWSASASVTYAATTVLTVADSTHGTSADSPALTQAHTLAVADSAHTSAIDEPTLAQAHTLAVADSAHAHSADAVTVEAPTTSEHQRSVGDGYTDGSAKQIVRTSGDRLYVVSRKFDTYPDGPSSPLRVYKADQTGIATSYTRMDSAHEPTAVAMWSAAIDGSDVIHIIWVERASWDTSTGVDNHLHYAQYSTSTDLWGTVEDVDTALNVTEYGQGDETCAIALDSDGVPHIVYLKDDGTRRRVNYRNRSGGTWSSATIVDDQSFGSNEKCWHPAIAFDDSARRVVLWHRGDFNGNSTARIFSRVYASGSWGTTHDVTGANVFCGIDTTSSLYIDASGRYHTTYLSATNKYVRYSYSDDQGATWTANNPSDTIGDDPQVGPGATGKVRIWCHGPQASNPNMVYWQGDGGSGSWGSQVTWIDQDGTPYDCTANVRWSRYFWNYPGTLDVAFWRATYPTNALYIGAQIVSSTLAVADSSHVHTADSPTLVADTLLTVADSGHTSGADNVTLSLEAFLEVADSTHASSAEAVALTQAHGLTVADSTHASAAEAVSVLQAHTLAVDAATHDHAADAPALTQAHSLTVADADHATSADSPSLTQAHSLTVADSGHASGADSPSLTQAHLLAVADSAHAVTADNVTLGAGDTLEVADVAHGHTADNVALTQLHNLTVADAAHLHAVDEVTLGASITLSVADVSHGHAADAIDLSQAHVLTVDAGTHVSTAESVALSQWHQLAVADSEHVTAADSPSLTQAHVLTVADVSHGYTVDGVVVTEGGAIVAARALAVRARDLTLEAAARDTTLAVRARDLTLEAHH